MKLFRALHAESLKIKRTMALPLVAICPAVIVVLVLFVTANAPFSTLHRGGTGREIEWANLTRFTLRFWALLMMPLYMTLQSALIAGLDHADNQWKSLLTRPVPRWTFYVAKLLVVSAMMASGMLVLLCGLFLNGAVLPRIQSQVVFGWPVPWTAILADGARVLGLSFLALTIQLWVSLRWRSFSVAVGTGIVAMVIGTFAVAIAQQVGGWPLYFPWSLPMMVVSREHYNIQAALLLSGAASFLVASAGCWDFCRREVQ